MITKNTKVPYWRLIFSWLTFLPHKLPSIHRCLLIIYNKKGFFSFVKPPLSSKANSNLKIRWIKASHLYIWTWRQAMQILEKSFGAESHSEETTGSLTLTVFVFLHKIWATEDKSLLSEIKFTIAKIKAHVEQEINNANVRFGRRFPTSITLRSCHCF